MKTPLQAHDDFWKSHWVQFAALVLCKCFLSAQGISRSTTDFTALPLGFAQLRLQSGSKVHPSSESSVANYISLDGSVFGLPLYHPWDWYICLHNLPFKSTKCRRRYAGKKSGPKRDLQASVIFQSAEWAEFKTIPVSVVLSWLII